MTSQRTRLRLINELRSLGISNEEILDRMQEMPRHLFVDEALASRAYENTALPIGFGQTISQPYTVARMTELLLDGDLLKNDHSNSVLEVGTGCGFQTLLLSKLLDRVITIERITKLHRKARDLLYDLRVRNVVYLLDDGFTGKFQGAPFDGILTTAVSPNIPQSLVDQLKVGGRIVMPLLTNKSQNEQHLVVLDKRETGIKKSIIEPVAFVPRQSGVI